MAVTEETQIYREAPYIEDYRRRLYESAFGVGDQPQLYPERQVATEDPLETQAIDLAAAGVGSYAPYLAAQQAGLTTAGTTAATGVSQLTGAAPTVAAGITPALAGMAGATQASLQQYMDPYQELVTQQALEEIDRQGAMAQQSLAAGATQAGAFGGARFGVAESELTRNLEDIKSRRVAEDLQKNYAQALGSFQDVSKRQLYGAGLLGQLGQGQANIGAQLGNVAQQQAGLAGQQGTMGQNLQQMTGVDIGTLAAVGAGRRGLGQQGLEAEYSTQLSRMGEPQQRLGFLSDVLSKVPSQQSAFIASTTPSLSPLAQAIGALIGVSQGAGTIGGIFGGGTSDLTGNVPSPMSQNTYGLAGLI